MKKTLLALALAAVCGASFAGTPAVSVSGTVNVTSSAGASSYVNGNGSSVSQASNVQTAITGVATEEGTSTRPCTNTTTSTAGLAAGTIVTSNSAASNVSHGNGTGSAGATGYSLVDVNGSVTAPTKHGVGASVNGGVNAIAQTGASAGTNQFEVAGGYVATGFIATAGASASSGKEFGITVDTNTASSNVVSGSIANSGSFGNGSSLVNVDGGSYGNASSVSNTDISIK